MILFVVFLAGYLVYGIIAFLVGAIVWMFTTFLGLFILAFFVVGVIVNFLAPSDPTGYDEGDEDEDEMGRR